MFEDHITRTVAIVAAYAATPGAEPSDIPALIADVYAALIKLGSEPVAALKQDPAVPIKKSVTPDFIICLEDGKKFKSLKLHLRATYDLSPEKYREKWGLPADYPMVAPNYAAARSELAKRLGLGQSRGST